MTDSLSGIPFELQNLHEGERYIKLDTALFKCSSSAGYGELHPDGEVITVLSKQMGRLVLEHDYSYISKSGTSVRHPEAEAMKLVLKHTSIPVPEVIFAQFSKDHGSIRMTIIPGSPVEALWDKLDDKTKKSVCRQTWDLIIKLREIQQQSDLKGLFQCAADGSPTRDPLIEDLQRPPRPLYTDSELRSRIYERYLHFGGHRYKNQLYDMLPQSYCSVFTHADIAPRNIMVDEKYQITGLLDWEYAGWYPDYWEYAQIMRPACQVGDWQEWMDLTAPQKWDISGINAARRVLF
jgi:hypothetical protein